jgi:hypothetical protein
MIITYKDPENIKQIKSEVPIQFDNIDILRTNISNSIFHKNYLEYLKLAWTHNYGIIIKPDYIWFTIMSELSKLVKKDSYSVKDVFVKNDTNTDISILMDDFNNIEIFINKITEQLQERIPSNINSFFPKFSTTDINSEFAFKAIFADLASTYYNYSMKACSFKKINVLGTIDDYKLMKNNLKEISKLLFKSSDITTYLYKVLFVIDNIIENFNNEQIWKDIFYIKYCGSGHQIECYGWYLDLFNNQPSPRYVENYSSTVAKVPYKEENVKTLQQ